MSQILKALKNLVIKGNRMPLIKASILLQKAIDEAEKKYKRTGHRYYIVYDPDQKKLIPITYDLYRNHLDSYIYLRRRGRMKNPLTREELKAKCFYYTPSKNTPDWKRSRGKEYEEKVKIWQRYYTYAISKSK